MEAKSQRLESEVNTLMKEKSVFEEDLVKSNEENDKFIQTIAQKDNEIQVKTYIYQSLGNPIFCENNFVKYCVELFKYLIHEQAFKNKRIC